MRTPVDFSKEPYWETLGDPQSASRLRGSRILRERSLHRNATSPTWIPDIHTSPQASDERAEVTSLDRVGGSGCVRPPYCQSSPIYSTSLPFPLMPSRIERSVVPRSDDTRFSIVNHTVRSDVVPLSPWPQYHHGVGFRAVIQLFRLWRWAALPGPQQDQPWHDGRPTPEYSSADSRKSEWHP